MGSGALQHHGDVVDPRDDFCDPITHQTVAACRRSAGDRPRYRAHAPPEFCCLRCHRQRGRSHTRFHNHDSRRQCSDHPSSLQQPPPRRSRLRRHFADQRASCGDPLKQLLVPRWVQAVKRARENSDGRPTCHQRGTMRDSIDAIRAARHHDLTLLSDTIGKLPSHMRAITGRCPRANEALRS